MLRSEKIEIKKVKISTLDMTQKEVLRVIHPNLSVTSDSIKSHNMLQS